MLLLSFTLQKYKNSMYNQWENLYFCTVLIHIKMIKENLEKIRATVPDGVTLVAISKTKPVSD